MKSMTGFGKAMYFNDDIELEIEIKSLNNRFLDIRQKLPIELTELENSLTDVIKNRMKRGKVEVKYNFIDKRPHDLQLDSQKWEHFSQLINNMQSKLKSIINVPIDFVINELKAIQKNETESSLDSDVIIATLTKALDKHQTSAFAEGAHMKHDILQSMTKIGSALREIETLFPFYKQETFEKMRNNIEEMLVEKISQDKLKDLLMEAAIYHEKSDVNEEIKRFSSHLKEFLNTCTKENENIGKRLQFILQEMQRECNTIGSKFCTEASFTYILICKEEIEKCREMIQNVE